MKPTLIAILLAAGFAATAQAAPAAPADLYLGITYYSRVLTPEGVTRESRYEEKMLRRPGHVWVERVLAPATDAHAGHSHGENRKVALKTSTAPTQHEHKHFNPVLIPRHVTLEKNTVRVEYIVGGRGAVAKGEAACDAAIEQTRDFLKGMIDNVGAVHKRGGTLKEAFEATHKALGPKFGRWPIFEHCLPFDVQRLWDEYEGIDWPRIWTAERDQEVWAQLQD